jgi:hypothetical protein
LVYTPDLWRISGVKPVRSERQATNMNLRVTRIRFILAAAAVGLMISTAMAVGAQPKKGSYSYTSINGASGYPTYQVYFSVVGGAENRKLKNFTAQAGYLCGDPVSMGTIRVKNNGSFNGAGNAEDLGGNLYSARVSGKFKTKTKATGTLSAPCLGNAGDFTAKKGGFEVCVPAGPGCRALSTRE